MVPKIFKKIKKIKKIKKTILLKPPQQLWLRSASGLPEPPAALAPVCPRLALEPFPFITLFKKITFCLICDQGCFWSVFLS